MGGKKAGTRWQKLGLEPRGGNWEPASPRPSLWKESPGVVC